MTHRFKIEKSVKTKELEEIKEAREKESPAYIVPKTTCPVELIKLTFNEKNYIIPKTTAGFL